MDCRSAVVAPEPADYFRGRRGGSVYWLVANTHADVDSRFFGKRAAR